jgi:serine-type D-Ala-D-Ala carboxypeptidase/endopeptidase
VIPRTKPRRSPGRKIRYSNCGAGLLGHVLALRAGTSYGELVAERIARPLGMADTSIAVPEDKLDRFAQGHNRRGRPVSNWDIPALAGAGALRSTVADLLRFLAAQLGAAPQPLAETIQMTHEPRARFGAFEVGLGWLMLPVRGRPFNVLWHDGGTGGFRSVAGFVSEIDAASSSSRARRGRSTTWGSRS